jgi:hypothetical protein
MSNSKLGLQTTGTLSIDEAVAAASAEPQKYALVVNDELCDVFLGTADQARRRMIQLCDENGISEDEVSSATSIEPYTDKLCEELDVEYDPDDCTVANEDDLKVKHTRLDDDSRYEDDE